MGSEATVSSEVRQTEQEALGNLTTVLQLCAAGKLRCSEKTHRLVLSVSRDRECSWVLTARAYRLGSMSASSDRIRTRAVVSASARRWVMTARPQGLFDGVSEPDVGAVVEVPRRVLIAELLELCDGFFAAAGPVVRVELQEFLISRGVHPGTALGWFYDVLSLTAAAEGRAARDACGRPGGVLEE